MEPQVQYLTTDDGVDIAYYALGEGPPLIHVQDPSACHVQRSWEIFSHFFPPLAQRFRVINFDPRGVGLSDRDKPDFSMEARIRDLDAVVDRVGLQSFAIVAFLSAVPVGVTYAATFPNRVSHLILIDGYSTFSDVAATPATSVHDALIDEDWTLFTETLGRVLVGFDDPHITEGLGEYVRACIEPDAFRALQETDRTYDVRDMLPNVTAKTLVLHNEDHRFVSTRAGQKLAAAIPDARFRAIDDVNYGGVPALVEEFVIESERTPASQRAGAMYTILFTDMASSTSLTQQLGDAAAQEVRRVHNDIVRSALSANGGSEIKHTGDGIMASFSTASSALDAAIAIQRGVAEHKAEHPDSPLAVYAGLNAGEPIAEDDDLFGTSINLAARICDHGEPGQILASDVVRQLAAGKNFLFSDLGETELRGFEDPVKLWELRWQDGS